MSKRYTVIDTGEGWFMREGKRLLALDDAVAKELKRVGRLMDELVGEEVE